MLPALKKDKPRLADVLTSCLAAVRGEENRLALPGVTKAVVVLVDGMGAAALKARAGHARTLAGGAAAASVIESGFPTTTAAALASLTTGAAPGEHGLVGYSVLDAANDRVVNQLSGWDALLDPTTWQRVPTVFEKATDAGIDAVVIGPARYADSGFTHAVLRGARYLSAATIAERLERAALWLREPGSGIAYVYVPELDSTGHAEGWESTVWTTRLELLDGAVATLVAALGKRDGLIVTADHGVIDIPATSHILFGSEAELMRGVLHIAGEPRCLQLHVVAEEFERLLAAWTESEGDRAWVVTRAEAIEAGWFGEVAPEVESRIGDILVAARKNVAYYTDENDPGRGMVGQHGSWSPAEVQVPLLRYGAFRN
jgi:predicted AlkP superfamily pyrophosphatase or phosphodiesterase